MGTAQTAMTKEQTQKQSGPLGQNPNSQQPSQKSNRKLPESQKTEPQNMPKSIFDMSTNPMPPKQDSSQLHSTGNVIGSVSETMTSGSKTVNSLYNQSQATGPILSSGKSEESNFKNSSKQSQEPVPDQSEPKTDQHAITESKKLPDPSHENEPEKPEKKTGSVLEPTELKSSFDKSNDKLEKMVTTVFFVTFRSCLFVLKMKERIIAHIEDSLASKSRNVALESLDKIQTRLFVKPCKLTVVKFRSRNPLDVPTQRRPSQRCFWTILFHFKFFI